MHFNERSSVHRLVLAGLLAALITLLTLAGVPIPFMPYAYVNLGDAAVYVAAALLGPVWGPLCAGVGSALADVLYGSMIYVLPTFIIKGLMAFFAALMLRRFGPKKSGMLYLSLAVAGLIMPIGYFIFEAFLYGAATALPGMLPNLAQYLAGVLLGVPGIRVANRIIRRD